MLAREKFRNIHGGKTNNNALFPLDDRQPALQREFEQYLRGKSVAIVGKGIRQDEDPSREWGDFIDSFDVVARVHWPIPYHGDVNPGDTSEEKPAIKWDPPPFVPAAWQYFVGRKTHIFYTTIAYAGAGIEWRKDIIRAFKAEGGKFICEAHPGIIAKKPEGKLAAYTPVRHVSLDVYNSLSNLLKSEPYGGTLAVADILRFDVSKVFITRLPCFFSDSDPEAEKYKGPNPHTKPRNDMRFLRELWEQNRDRITIDPFMEYVFGKYGDRQ